MYSFVVVKVVSTFAITTISHSHIAIAVSNIRRPTVRVDEEDWNRWIYICGFDCAIIACIAYGFYIEI